MRLTKADFTINTCECDIECIYKLRLEQQCPDEACSPDPLSHPTREPDISLKRQRLENRVRTIGSPQGMKATRTTHVTRATTNA